MSTIKLYDCDTAPSPRRTRILQAEKGVEHQIIQVDLRNSQQLSDEYKAINPRCTVPFLITEDGQGLSENVAIALYLEEVKPNPIMIGRTPIEKARTLEWNSRVEFECFVAAQEILRNTSKALKGRALTGPHNIEQIPELADRGRYRLELFYNDLNHQLKHNDFVAGNFFSFADISAVVAIDFSKWVKMFPDGRYASILQWHSKISKRSSYSA